MAVNLDTLVTGFRDSVEALIANWRSRGVDMRPHSAVRTPVDQARLWRQSRAREEIAAWIASFRADGAEFLAFCIESAGPQHGDHVTNSPPGFSWHQWGEAVDCFWVVDGKAEWSTVKKINGLNGYQVFAAEAEALGLTAGGHWARFKDWPHAQLRVAGSPTKVMTVRDIDAEMRARFGG